MHCAAERIPYDVLREIIRYTYVYELELPPEELEFNLQVSSPPISASQVCRKWRGPLVSDSSMWTCLVVNKMSHSWITELLRRSKTAPLNVFLNLNIFAKQSRTDDEKQKLLFSVFNEINRFKALRVRMDYTDAFSSFAPKIKKTLIEQVLCYLQEPAPNLEVLSLWYHKRDNNYNPVPDHSIVNNLFSKNASNIRRMHHRLSLTSTFQTSNCFAFHNLSELSLTLISRVDYRCFLDLITLSPGLRLLHLSGDSYVNPNWESLIGRQVNLPHLKNLVFNVQDIRVVDSFLQDMVFPRNIKWYFFSENRLDFEPQSLIQFLSQEHFKSVDIDAAHSEEYVRLFSDNQSVNDHDIQPEYNEFSYFNIERENSINSRDPLIYAIVWTRVRHMTLKDISDCTGVVRIFSLASNLRSLVIKQTSQRSRESIYTCSNCLAVSLIPLWELPIDLEFLGHRIDSKQPLPLPFCPLLRKVILKLEKPLDEDHNKLLGICCNLRRVAQHPIHARVQRYYSAMNEEMDEETDEEIDEIDEIEDLDSEDEPVEVCYFGRERLLSILGTRGDAFSASAMSFLAPLIKH